MQILSALDAMPLHYIRIVLFFLSLVQFYIKELQYFLFNIFRKLNIFLYVF